MSKHNFSRRSFLGSMMAAAGTAATPFTVNLAAMSNAAAQTAGDYKALVCLFMMGGNDAFNTVLATDSTSWNEYQRLRSTGDSASIALPGVGASGGVLPIAPTNNQGRAFALHPRLGNLKALFDSGNAAIIANVGTLVQPTTLAQYKAASVKLPPKLFSHNDQQSMWQSDAPEGSSSGWGGRMGDIIASSNSNNMFSCISISGNAVFLTGKQTRQLQITTSGLPGITNLNTSLFGAMPGANPLRAIITGQGGNKFQNDHAAVVNRAINAQQTLASAMAPAGAGGIPDPTPYTNPNTGIASTNPLAVQLQAVARVIAGRNTLGVKRQVFYVSMNGFDTHGQQLTAHGDMMARVDHAIAYFNSVMASLQGTDMRQQVTLFTASDFGRTFTTNGNGTDHGWGSHHFIVGGAVKGKDIYGSFPITGINHDLDVGSGSLLPTTSVDQYGATLATWFGVPANQLATIFPNIGNFTTKNLGFMG
ncbi:DUF1501 domain-containing protein [Pseudoduganella sp. FT26W]|uniref:DUF1501 domain-containing protein n=1 Tax=Duganella aquatilis TaxID=2666082 RepID=A0A844DBJ5_9BURK|nr:DUF1501 domain-containing protein [Duganella aquatilis]MRW86272.1 DUF1501 domain-containing protein [Duganella aquatilis]